MPTKRESGDLAVPDIAEDAAERKRVLNVLAQRRYRKRRKDRLQTLQAQVEKQGEKSDPLQHSLTSDFGIDALSEPLPHQDLPDSAIQDVLNTSLPDITSSPGFLSLLSTPGSFQAFTIPQISANDDPFAYQSPPPPQLLLGQGPEPSSDEEQLVNWPNPNLVQPNNASNLSDQLQISESSTFTFPDDHIIEIPSLKLLTAAMKVALRLNVAHILWDITAVSPFYRGAAQRSSHLSLDGGLSPTPPAPSLTSSSLSPSSNASPQYNEILHPYSDLPEHLRPTQTQFHLPHHPALDILPWPGTRDKLIQIFNLPPSLRPKSAQDPMGMVRLVYDMEDDSGEGIRISGADVFEPGAWEIGQLVFERWWWAFEGSLIEKCDQARKGRGELGLVLELEGQHGTTR